MECFTEFYELLENLMQPPVVEKDDEQGTIDDDFKSDLSTGIEEKYFDKIDHASSMQGLQRSQIDAHDRCSPSL